MSSERDVTIESENKDSSNSEKSVNNDKDNKDLTEGKDILNSNSIMDKDKSEKLEDNEEIKTSDNNKDTNEEVAIHETVADIVSNQSTLDKSQMTTDAVNSEIETNPLPIMLNNEENGNNVSTTIAPIVENIKNQESVTENAKDSVNDVNALNETSNIIVNNSENKEDSAFKDISNTIVNNAENMEVSASKDTSNTTVNNAVNMEVSITEKSSNLIIPEESSEKVAVTNKAKESKSNTKPAKADEHTTKVDGVKGGNIVETLIYAISRTDEYINHEKANVLLLLFLILSQKVVGIDFLLLKV